MDKREIANSLLAVVDQAAYKNSANRIVGLRLAVGGRRVFSPVRSRTVFAEAARGTVVATENPVDTENAEVVCSR